MDVARNKQREAEAQVALSEANVTTAADVKQKEALLQQAEIDLAYTKIAAPQGGRITHRSVEAGNYLQTGQAMFSIVPHDVWVTANFKETQSDLYEGRASQCRSRWTLIRRKGTRYVDSIQAGTGAQFSLLPPENAAGNYVKVVQRVPVKIVFDERSRHDFRTAFGRVRGAGGASENDEVVLKSPTPPIPMRLP